MRSEKMSLSNVQSLKKAPMQQARFPAQWNIASMKMTLWPRQSISSRFIAPMEKTQFYEILFFKVVTAMVKDKKMQYKIYNINQNQFYALRKVSKSNATHGFRGISNGLYFFATFFLSLSLSIVKRSTLAKIWGGCSRGEGVSTDLSLIYDVC